MTSPIVGYAQPSGEPYVRGFPVVELAITVRVPTCPICGKEHRFPFLSWGTTGRHIWHLTCPVVMPPRRFLVQVMGNSLAAVEREADAALAALAGTNPRWEQLGRTWILGLTWVPDEEDEKPEVTAGQI